MKRALLTSWLIFRSEWAGLSGLVLVGGLIYFVLPLFGETASIEYVGEVIVFVTVLALCAMGLYLGSWSGYLFRISESKRHFWLTIFFLVIIHLSTLIATMFVFGFSSRTNFVSGLVLSRSPLEWAWMLLLALTLDFCMFQDAKSRMYRLESQGYWVAIGVSALSSSLMFLFILLYFTFPDYNFLVQQFSIITS